MCKPDAAVVRKNSLRFVHCVYSASRDSGKTRYDKLTYGRARKWHRLGIKQPATPLYTNLGVSQFPKTIYMYESSIQNYSQKTWLNKSIYSLDLNTVTVCKNCMQAFVWKSSAICCSLYYLRYQQIAYNSLFAQVLQRKTMVLVMVLYPVGTLYVLTFCFFCRSIFFFKVTHFGIKLQTWWPSH